MKGKTAPATNFFVAVIQADFAEQMQVLRWLEEDRSYAVVYILHDKDTFTQDEIESRRENEKDSYFTRKNGDGSESQFSAGDTKPGHYHLIVKTRTKTRASTLCKRFCDQVHFFAASEAYGDKYEAAKYLTHECFRARAKHQYSRDCVQYGGEIADSIQLYDDLMLTDDTRLLDSVETFIELKQLGIDEGWTDEAATSAAIISILENKDTKTLKSIMAHSYFYDRMLKLAPSRKEREENETGKRK